MPTPETIAVSALLVCLAATFGLKSAVAQEVDAGAEAGAAVALARTSAGVLSSAPPLPGTVQAGSGELRFLGLSMYRARLWVSPLLDASDFGAHPLALELIYQRAFSAASLARRSLAAMQRIGPFSEAQSIRWQQALQAVLPDVQPGDRMVGLYRPGQGATFVLRGRTVGTVADAEFARLFFGVWLSPRTSEPALRAALLGARA